MNGEGFSRSEALLVAIASFVLVSIVDGAFRDVLKQSPVWFWVFDVFKFVVLPGTLLLWLARAVHIPPPKYGLGTVAENESWAHFLGFVIFVTVILYLIYQGAGALSWIIFRRPEPVLFYKNMAPDGVFRIPVVLYLALTAGFVEEVFFRGLPLLYLQIRCPSSLPAGSYVFATSALFGASHWENGAHEVVATFTFGIFASLFYLKLRDLWPLIGAHTLSDVWDFW